MEGVKILHAADLHIGSARSELAKSKGRAEIKNTFFRIVKFCERAQIDFALIAGDLFDTPFTDSETLTEVTFAMQQCPSTTFVISPGNHDCACAGSVYLDCVFPENVVVFTSFMEHIDFPEKNVRIFGAAFTDKFERLPLLSGAIDLNPNMINLCVLHGDIIPSSSESEYNPITLDSIARCGFDYLALGHIHKRSEIKKLGHTFYSYCGCPDGRGFHEEGSCGVYAGTVAKGICKLDYLEFSSRQYVSLSVDISGFENSLQISSKILGHLKQAYPEHYGEHLYRINLIGTIDSNFSPSSAQLEAELSEELLFVRIKDCTYTNLGDISKIAAESSLRGIFAKKILEMTETADPTDAQLYHNALKLGLKAFEREVSLSDN